MLVEAANSNFYLSSDAKAVRIPEQESKGGGEVRRHWVAKIAANPFFLFFLAFINALIYLLIPSNNFWVFDMVKSQWWAFLAIIVFTEIYDISMPDASEFAYVSSYYCGFFVPPLLRIVSYLLDQQSNLIINTVAVNSAIIITFIFYGWDALQRPFPSTPCQSVKATNHLSSSTSDTLYADTYRSCSIDQLRAQASTLSSPPPPSPPPPYSPPPLSHSHPPTQGMVSFSGGGSFIAAWLNSLDMPSFEGVVPSSNITGSRAGFRGTWDPASASVESPFNALHSRPRASSSSRSIQMPLISSTAATRHNQSSNEVHEGEGEGAAGGSWQLPSSQLPATLTGRILPRFLLLDDSNAGQQSPPCCTADRRWQLALVTAFNMMSNLFFYFLIIFTEEFRSNSSGGYSAIALFVLYITVCNAFRSVIKQLGLSLDGRKRGTVSMYFVGEVMCLLFYFTFYRVLFESISSWPEFMLLLLIHFAWEWFSYPLRCSACFFSAANALESHYPLLKGWLLVPGMDQRDFLALTSLDFGIRCTVMVATALAILGLLLCIDFVPWANNDLKQTSGAAIELEVEFVVVAALLELVNAFVINHFFFQPQGADILLRVKQCFANQRFAFVAMMLASNYFINPIFAFLSQNNGGLQL